MHPMLLLGDAAPLGAALAAVLASADEAGESEWGATVASAACGLVHARAALFRLQVGKSVREFAHGSADLDATAHTATVRTGATVPRSEGDVRVTLVCRLVDDEAVLRNVNRWQAVLGLLRPALTAAIRERYVRGTLGQIARVIDAIDEAVATCTLDGRILHEGEALRRLVAVETDAAHIREEVARAARMAGRATHGPPATHELHTRRSSYELGARRIAAEPGTEIALVTVRRAHAGDTRRAAELFQTRFGLSQRETEVARLLISGRQNADIARDLGISASTARHHTQRVLDKLGVHSRAAIPSLVITRADEPEPRDR